MATRSKAQASAQPASDTDTAGEAIQTVGDASRLVAGSRIYRHDNLTSQSGGTNSESRFDELTGFDSLPFARPPALPAGRPWRVAVKMIDPRGNDGLRVLTLPE